MRDALSKQEGLVKHAQRENEDDTETWAGHHTYKGIWNKEDQLVRRKETQRSYIPR